MGILAVNLKHYYQRRGLWLWYIFIASQVAIVLVPVLEGKFSETFITGKNRMLYFACLMVTFMPGLIVGTMQKEAMSKPFMFCMSGHREVSRKVVFLIGGVISVLLSVMFVAYPEVSISGDLPVIAAGGFLMMLLYLFGVMRALDGVENMGILQLITVVICGLIIFGFGKQVAIAVLTYPAVVIGVGVIVCACAWRWLGRDSLARENCGKLVVGIMDGWNMEKKRRYREEMLKKKMGKQDTGIFAGLEEFFLGRMARCEFLSMSRYVWGHVYAVMGRGFGAMRWRNLILWPILILVCGYLGRDGFSTLDIVFVMFPIMATIMVNLNAYPTVLVPGGRRERAWGAVVSGVVITVSVLAFVSVLVLVSMWLETILPAITVKGYDLEYAAMSFGKLPLLLIFMPLSLAMGMLFPRGVIAKFVMIIIMSQVWFVGGTLSRVEFFKPIAAINNPVSVAVIIAAVWLLYLWSIDRHFRRGQLV